MYQTYSKDWGADALICFPFSKDAMGWCHSKFIFPFRNKLIETILKATNLYLLKYEGEPTNADSRLLFFYSEDDLILIDEFSKHPTGFWDWIFKTKNYKEFIKEEKKIESLIQIQIITSHDHPCIEVLSSIHSEDSLSSLIETTARELNIDMSKNSKLPSMTDIICSNRTFDMPS